MFNSTMLLLTVGAVALAPTASAPPPDIREWTVPWEGSRPRDPFVDPKGRVWLVGQQGNYVAYLDPVTGRFERYEVDAGTHPHNLVVDAKGMIWFTGNANGEPHTMIFDRAGNAWFTAQQAGAVGRLEVSSGRFRIWRTGAGTRPLRSTRRARPGLVSRPV